MIFESFFSFASCFITCVWFFTNKLFFYNDVAFTFKGFYVRSKVSISNTKKFLEHREIGTFIDHQNRHDAQSNTMVKGFVDILDEVFQSNKCQLWFLIWLNWLIVMAQQHFLPMEFYFRNALSKYVLLFRWLN